MSSPMNVDNYQQLKEAIDVIREMISKGELPVDKHINIDELVKHTPYSKELIQECLAILAREGAVDSISESGFRIRKFTVDEIREVIKVRKEIEKNVVQELAKNIDEKKLTVLKNFMTLMRKSKEEGNRGIFIKQAIDFHSKLAELAGFELASNVLQALQYKNRILGLQAISDKEGADMQKMEDDMNENSKIIEAIESGDSNKAGEVMVQHLVLTTKRLLPDLSSAI